MVRIPHILRRVITPTGRPSQGEPGGIQQAAGVGDCEAYETKESAKTRAAAKKKVKQGRPSADDDPAPRPDFGRALHETRVGIPPRAVAVLNVESGYYGYHTLCPHDSCREEFEGRASNHKPSLGVSVCNKCGQHTGQSETELNREAIFCAIREEVSQSLHLIGQASRKLRLEKKTPLRNPRELQRDDSSFGMIALRALKEEAFQVMGIDTTMAPSADDPPFSGQASSDDAAEQYRKALQKTDKYFAERPHGVYSKLRTDMMNWVNMARKDDYPTYEAKWKASARFRAQQTAESRTINFCLITWEEFMIKAKDRDNKITDPQKLFFDAIALKNIVLAGPGSRDDRSDGCVLGHFSEATINDWKAYVGRQTVKAEAREADRGGRVQTLLDSGALNMGQPVSSPPLSGTVGVQAASSSGPSSSSGHVPDLTEVPLPFEPIATLIQISAPDAAVPIPEAEPEISPRSSAATHARDLSDRHVRQRTDLRTFAPSASAGTEDHSRRSGRGRSALDALTIARDTPDRVNRVSGGRTPSGPSAPAARDRAGTPPAGQARGSVAQLRLAKAEPYTPPNFAYANLLDGAETPELHEKIQEAERANRARGVAIPPYLEGKTQGRAKGRGGQKGRGGAQGSKGKGRGHEARSDPYAYPSDQRRGQYSQAEWDSWNSWCSRGKDDRGRGWWGCVWKGPQLLSELVGLNHRS